MRTQQFNKKLSLKKNTVENLDPKTMHDVKGGYFFTYFDYSCWTWCECQTNFYHCPTDLTQICP